MLYGSNVQSCSACNKARATRLVVDKEGCFKSLPVPHGLKIKVGQNASYNGHGTVIFMVKSWLNRNDGLRNSAKNNESNIQLLCLRKMCLGDSLPSMCIHSISKIHRSFHFLGNTTRNRFLIPLFKKW